MKIIKGLIAIVLIGIFLMSLSSLWGPLVVTYVPMEIDPLIICDADTILASTKEARNTITNRYAESVKLSSFLQGFMLIVALVFLYFSNFNKHKKKT